MTTIELVNGLKKDDKKCQEFFYLRYRKMIKGFCLSQGCQFLLVEDLVHDIIIKVFEKIRMLKDPSMLEGWVFMLARNMVVNQLRLRVRWNKDGMIYDYRSYKLLSYDPEREYIIKDEIRVGTKVLGPGMHLILMLYGYEGYTHKEIADKLGISIGNSKSQLSRAKVRCREKIDEYRKVKVEL